MSVLQKALHQISSGQDLSQAQTAEVMNEIMTGQCTDAQIGGFLMAMVMKGETSEEIAGAAEVMRALSTKVPVSSTEHLIDTCGTGGDGASIFNVSTTVAFVAAAAGAKVAKHGNRSISSSSGSADVLMQAGAELSLTPEQIGRAVDEIGIGFMFAPHHHGAMKYAIGPRKELAHRTIFNVLGPLTNPASAPAQVMGIYDKALLVPVAEVMKRLGTQHALVVHSQDGLDEISLAAPTDVVELKDGDIQAYQIAPEDFGFQTQSLDSLKVANSEESLALVKGALSGEHEAARDIVALNAGAAIYVAGIASTLKEGVLMAEDAIGSGLAKGKLSEFVDFTKSFSEVNA